MISKFSIKDLKGDPVISEEIALEVLRKTCAYFDVDVDSEIDPDKKRDLETTLSAILDYMMYGQLEIDTETWDIKQNLKLDYGSTKDIVYKQADGNDIIVTDGMGEKERVRQLYSVLGKISGLGDHVIKKLKGIDKKVAMSIGLFLF